MKKTGRMQDSPAFDRSIPVVYALLVVKVKFFAMLRQIVGQSEAEVDVEGTLSVRQLINKLSESFPGLPQALKDAKAMVAVNHEFAGVEDPVADGDEVAFIPPMSGGESPIKLQREDFSVDAEVARLLAASTNIGGIVAFVGTAREFSRGRHIHELEFEHYPGMAEKQLADIRERALANYDIIEVSIVHRFGKIPVGDNIVLIVVGAEHRKDAFAACEWCIDELKQITPIWKKEVTTEGEVWVEEHP